MCSQGVGYFLTKASASHFFVGFIV